MIFSCRIVAAAALVMCAAALPSAAETQRSVGWVDCVGLASQNNHELKSAREKLSQAEAAAGVTRAELLPSVSATASGVRSSSENAVGTTTGNTYSYGIEGKQLIFDGLKSVYDYKGARSSVESAKLDYQISSASVRYNLRSAYVGLLQAQELVALSAEIEKIRKHNLDLVQVKFTSGTEHRGSLLSAKADYAQAQADVRSAERALVLSRTSLCAAMGITYDPSLSAQGSLSFDDRYSQSPSFPNLAQHHPSVIKARVSEETAQYALRSAQLTNAPSIYGTGSYAREGAAVSALHNNWSVGVQMSVPLIEGGSQYYGVKKAQAALRQAQEDAKTQSLSVSVSLETSWTALRDAVGTAFVQSEYLAAELEREKIATAQYSIGRMSFNDWTVIESAFVLAKQSYLSAAASVLKAEAQWIQSTGGVLDNEAQK